MTIPSASSSNTYTGNDVAYTFSFTFPITSKSHLVVTHIASDGTETVLAENTNYTVTWAGAGNSGSITRIQYVGLTPTNYPLASGESIRLERTVPIVQSTDVRNAAQVRTATIENIADYLTSIDQQQQRTLDDHETRVQYVENNLPSGSPVSSAMQPVVAASTTTSARELLGAPSSGESIAYALIFG